jgi:glutaminyl-peptide cyclotransferase
LRRVIPTLGVAVFVAGGAAACAGHASATQAKSPTSAGSRTTPATQPAFDISATLHWVDLQLAYGPRPAGSPALRRLAVRLRALLPGGVFEPFDHGLRNIISVVPGVDPQYTVVVGAHYDTKDLPGYLGANNGAAGTAVVLQLARTLRPRTVRPTVVFMLFDGEESPGGIPSTPRQFVRTGLRGSKEAAPRYRNAKAMILMDFIGQRGLSIPREKFSNPALWLKLRTAARVVGAAAAFPAGPLTSGVYDDHLPFAWQGVPAVDLIDPQYACWFRSCDDRSQISPQSLGIVGRTVLELLREL